MVVSLNHAFDQTALSYLLFLQHTQDHHLLLSGDGVLPFAPLIATGLARYQLVPQETPSMMYVVQLTSKGAQIIDAWCSGDREAIKQVLNDLSQRQ